MIRFLIVCPYFFVMGHVMSVKNIFILQMKHKKTNKT